MRPLAIAAAALTAAAAAGGGALAAEETSPLCIPRADPVPQGPAELVSESGVDGTGGRMRRLRLDSPALDGQTSVNVLLPEAYDPSGATRYPVLYLLHGGIGSYDDWRWGGNVVGIVDEVSRSHDLAPFVVVMPDGGKWGFYSDWYGTDVAAGEPDPPPAWATYHVGELIGWIDANFPTLARREGRAVAGLSMGGFGAMSYAARFPQLFASAGSFSGAVHPNLDYPAGNAFLTGASIYFDEGNLRNCVWGDMLTQRVRWQGHDPTHLAANLGHTALYIASGGGDHTRPEGLASDPVEQTVYLMSRALADALDAEGIERSDDFYGAGTHTWDYWQRDLRRYLPEMAAAWADPPTAPPAETFDHSSIAPRFEAWGWRFESQRDATEFVHLEDVGRDGLTVTGSGRLDVVTDELYEPDALYEVTGTGQLHASEDGRLAFAIDFDSQGDGRWKQVRVDISPAGS